jgi:hypothetical protein
MIDISGRRFGRWEVLRFSHEKESRAKYWLCRCDCGTERAVNSSMLISGKTVSCGCFMRENNSRLSRLRTKHGMYKSSEYRIWQLMKERCHTPQNPAYPRYGGRGIHVCRRWRNSFENFYADMGPRPKESQLDRIDNNEGYSKSNCRWADHVTQQSNRRDNRIISFQGKTQTMAAWGDQIGISRATMYRRLQRWPLERALTRLD